MSRARRSSFVVRVVEDRRGQVTGVIERVATGAKVAFGDLEAIGQMIRGMLRDTGPASSPGCDPGRRPTGPPPP